jgi:hypothetical protein
VHVLQVIGIRIKLIDELKDQCHETHNLRESESFIYLFIYGIEDLYLIKKV